MAIEDLPDVVAGIVRRGVVTADDIGQLRSRLFGDILVEAEEAEWLFLIDRTAVVKCPEWSAFFLDAVVPLAVDCVGRRGVIGEAEGGWLIACLAPAGTIRTFNGLEALVRMIEAAGASPQRLATLALREVAAAVLDGSGPLAGHRQHRRGVIGGLEVDYIRRVLCRRGGRPVVGRAEAEILITLNEASEGADNDPAFQELFILALASFLLPAASAEAAGDLELLWHDLRRRGGEPSVAAWPVTYGRLAPASSVADDARWLAGRLGHGGALTANERLLLEVLFEENPDLHPSLRTLVDTAA